MIKSYQKKQKRFASFMKKLYNIYCFFVKAPKKVLFCKKYFTEPTELRKCGCVFVKLFYRFRRADGEM